MARIRLRRYEFKEDDLPALCLRCGEPSTVVKDKTFSWSPGWIYALLFAGMLPFLIVALVMTKRMRVPVPLCDAHENHWSIRSLTNWLGFLGVVILWVSTGVVSEQAAPGQGADSPAGWLFGLAMFGTLIWLIVALILQTSAIRAAEIDHRSITLTKVSRDFVDAVWARRDQDEEERDDRGRPRGRRENSRGFHHRDTPRGRPADYE